MSDIGTGPAFHIGASLINYAYCKSKQVLGLELKFYHHILQYCNNNNNKSEPESYLSLTIAADQSNNRTTNTNTALDLQYAPLVR